jgi:cysteine desulfurase
MLLEARKKIAKILHVKSSQIFFTSSVTESNNLFIKGLVLQNFKNKKPTHIVYSESDHSSIVETVKACKLFGATLSTIAPSQTGKFDTEKVIEKVRPETSLICFSLVSSETGTLQEVRHIVQEVRKFCEESGWEVPKLYIDASQAALYEPLDFSNMMIDGASLSSGKSGGVPGVALLYVKQGTKLEPLISGGGQEEGVRSGTENVPGIVAFAKILERVTDPEIQLFAKQKISKLKYYLQEKLKLLNKDFGDEVVKVYSSEKAKIYNDNYLHINQKQESLHESLQKDVKVYYDDSLPHIVLLHVKDILGEELLLRLDAKGISVSTATACSLLENSGSNLLKSLGEPMKAKETIRVSFSSSNTYKEIDYFIRSLGDIIRKYAR